MSTRDDGEGRVVPFPRPVLPPPPSDGDQEEPEPASGGGDGGGQDAASDGVPQLPAAPEMEPPLHLTMPSFAVPEGDDSDDSEGAFVGPHLEDPDHPTGRDVVATGMALATALGVAAAQGAWARYRHRQALADQARARADKQAAKAGGASRTTTTTKTTKTGGGGSSGGGKSGGGTGGSGTKGGSGGSGSANRMAGAKGGGGSLLGGGKSGSGTGAKGGGGAKGADGKGSSGAKGATGPKGSSGPKGADGKPGKDGSKEGSKGGSKGSSGPKGSSGKNGKDSKGSSGKNGGDDPKDGSKGADDAAEDAARTEHHSGGRWAAWKAARAAWKAAREGHGDSKSSGKGAGGKGQREEKGASDGRKGDRGAKAAGTAGAAWEQHQPPPWGWERMRPPPGATVPPRYWAEPMPEETWPDPPQESQRRRPDPDRPAVRLEVRLELPAGSPTAPQAQQTQQARQAGGPTVTTSTPTTGVRPGPSAHDDAEVTIHDVIAADADMAEQISDVISEAERIGDACTGLIGNLETLHAQIVNLRVPGTLAAQVMGLIDQTTVVRARAAAMADLLPMASEAIRTAGSNAAARHKPLADAVRDAGHARPAEREYHND